MTSQAKTTPDDPVVAICPRCEGRMFFFNGVGEQYYDCLMCGHHEEVEYDNSRFTGGNDQWKRPKNLGRPKNS